MQTLYKYEASCATNELYLDYLPTYDQHRFISTVTNKTVFGGSDLNELAQFVYDYDKAGNRVANAGHRGTGLYAEGFAQIQNIPDYHYDGLHRLTAVDYDQGVGTASEVFDYDDLGNRVTYRNDRNAVTTAYANNVANEYTTVGGTSVEYDAAGNLTLDERDFGYEYDYENRLTKVTAYDLAGETRTVVGQFAYDALGRMVSSQMRYDADATVNETLKYYYDGQNALAEYDESDNLSRRYVHGTSYVDERAILLEGEGDDLDSYYYLLQELYSVAGLMKKNGVLAEAYVYDAYGQVTPWVLPPAADFDRSGNYTTDDLTAFSYEYGVSNDGVPTGDPVGDVDQDGDCDYFDMLDLLDIWNDWYEVEPVSLRVSSLGNSFFFTGRRLHFLDDTSQLGLHDNYQVQYNRRRHYLPGHGRWLQRDPAGYVDGMNLYEYARSTPGLRTDDLGLWSVERMGDWTARATSANNDGILALANVIKLDPNQWRKWLTVHGAVSVKRGGKAVRVSLAGLRSSDRFCPNQKVRVPNAILAHWGGFGGGSGKGWVNWNSEIRTLKDRGFGVDERTELTAGEFEYVVARAQQFKRLHGIYAWGHGGQSGYQTKFTVPDGVPYETYYTYYRNWQPYYRMGFGYIGACYSSNARPQFSINGAFWGYAGVLNPVIPPWQWGFTAPSIGQLLPPGAQGTRR